MSRYPFTQSFMISEAELRPLIKVATESRVSKSYLIRELIRKGLDEQIAQSLKAKTPA